MGRWENWSAVASPPTKWTTDEIKRASFAIALESNDTAAARPQTMNRSKICMRPPITFLDGVHVPAQRLDVEDSFMPGTQFYNLTDKHCSAEVSRLLDMIV